jgi:hypothetical protein
MDRMDVVLLGIVVVAAVDLAVLIPSSPSFDSCLEANN